ncbi:MAG: hypothetical protein PHC75_00320 [Burkholderiales bacterium]|nr:hypothetical protein [Burkholderiales bacterium]
MIKSSKSLRVSFAASLLGLTCANYASANNSSTNIYGNLNSYNLAKNYTLPEITNAEYAAICSGIDKASIQCQNNLANLQKSAGFDIRTIESNSAGVKSVLAYNITYNTPNYIPDGSLKYQSRDVSGTVFIPNGISADKIKGVILYYHPTMYNYNDYSPSANIVTGASYPAMYASQGFIVVLADLPGFGIDNTEMHPYIFPKINVTAGVNMLKATNTLLEQIGMKRTSKYPLILNGFSEGGMLAQMASSMIQTNQVSLDDTNTKLSLTVPMAGAFDLTKTQIAMAYSNITAPKNNDFRVQSQSTTALAKVGLIAYTVNSYNYYTNTKCNSILIDKMCNFSIPGISAKNISEIFESVDIADTMTIQAKLYENALNVSDYGLDNNSISNIMQKNLPSDYRVAIDEITLFDWKTKTPIEYIHLKNDSLVTPLNSILAAKKVRAKSAKGLVNRTEINNDNYVEGIDKAGIDHNNPIMYAFALGIFNKYFK